MPDPISWDEVVARIAAGEPADDVLDEKHAADRQEFRALLADMGPKGIAALASYDKAMRDFDLGLTQARSAWHSISRHQRDVLVAACRTKNGRIVRRSFKPSVYVLDGTLVFLCRVATIRNLCAHELLACDGGAFDPEQAAVITERGRFVVAKGPSADA